MAREENLKKINEELEKLSDEELENVVGGIVFYRQNTTGNPNDRQNQTPESGRFIPL